MSRGGVPPTGGQGPVTIQLFRDMEATYTGHMATASAATTVERVLEDMFRSHLVDSADVARVLGTSVRSVNRWTSAGTVPRRNSEERLLELKAVLDLLRDVLREEPARLWLRSPQPDLDYEKPIELIERGEYRRVIGSVLALAEGVTS